MHLESVERRLTFNVLPKRISQFNERVIKGNLDSGAAKRESRFFWIEHIVHSACYVLYLDLGPSSYS